MSYIDHDCAAAEANIGLLRREVKKLQTELLAARHTNGELGVMITGVYDLVNRSPQGSRFSGEEIFKALDGES